MSYRRKYRPGRCEDCGRGPVTQVLFWVNGMPYTVCKDHAREYQRVILRPGNLSDPYWTTQPREETA